MAAIKENNSVSMFRKPSIKHRGKRKKDAAIKISELIHPQETTSKAGANGFSVTLASPFLSKCNLP